jgi:hypothetical protein
MMVFSAIDTLKKRLSHVKPKQHGLEKEVIYKIPCECGANWLKLSKLQEKDINEENISSLLAAHAAENKHVKWEEVKILGKENHYKKRKIHEAVAMHIESNVISQPSYEISPLWHSI